MALSLSFFMMGKEGQQVNHPIPADNCFLVSSMRKVLCVMVMEATAQLRK